MECRDGRILHALKGGKGDFGRVAFDPAGRMLASCGGEKTVRLWEVANGALVRTLKGHSQASLVFHGRKTAAGSLHVRWTVQSESGIPCRGISLS